MALCLPFPCFSPYNVGFQALVPGSFEIHLLCHVTLLYCHVDPKAISKAISKAKKLFHVIIATPHTSSHVATTCSFEPIQFIQLTVFPLVWIPPYLTFSTGFTILTSMYGVTLSFIEKLK